MTNRILNWKFLSVRGMFSESLYWEWRIRRFWRLSHYCQAERSLIMGLMSLFVPARQPETWLDETWSWWWMVWPVDTRVGVGHWDLHQLGGGGGEEREQTGSGYKDGEIVSWIVWVAPCLTVLKICFLDCVTIWFLEFQLDWNLVKIILTFSFAINLNRDTSCVLSLIKISQH